MIKFWERNLRKLESPSFVSLQIIDAVEWEMKKSETRNWWKFEEELTGHSWETFKETDSIFQQFRLSKQLEWNWTRNTEVAARFLDHFLAALDWIPSFIGEARVIYSQCATLIAWKIKTSIKLARKAIKLIQFVAEKAKN